LTLLVACSSDSPVPPIGDGGIRLERVGASELIEIEVGDPRRVQNSGHSTFFVATRASDDLLIEVDSASAEVIRTIGRRGEGPGEYRYPGMMLTKSDSLLLQNSLDGSITVFGPDGGFVRRFPTDVPVQMGQGLLLRGDTILVAEPAYSPDAFGLPL